MKKLVFLSMAVAASVLSQAQPVINNMLNYTTGIQFKRMMCATAGIEPGSAGSGNHWNFTNLQVTDSQQAWIVDPATTPFASSFPGASYAVRRKDGQFDFVSKSGGKNYVLGFADSSTGMTVTYPDSLLEAVRPFTMTTAETDTFRVLNGTTTGTGEVTMTADADGMLHLPNAVYTNVLRVKTVYHQIDTISPAPVPVIAELKATRYAWYDDVHKSPLLVWDSTFIMNSIGAFSMKTISYLEYESGTAGIPEGTANSLDFTASINNSTLFVKGEFEQTGKYYISLFSADGKKVQTVSHSFHSTSASMDIQTDLSAGIYLLYITDGRGKQGFLRVAKN